MGGDKDARRGEARESTACSVVAQAGRAGEATAHRGPETGRHTVAAGNYWRAPRGMAGGRGRPGNSRGLGAREARGRGCVRWGAWDRG